MTVRRLKDRAPLAGSIRYEQAETFLYRMQQSHYLTGELEIILSGRLTSMTARAREIIFGEALLAPGWSDDTVIIVTLAQLDEAWADGSIEAVKGLIALLATS